jgi:hypothetical protein
MTQSDNVNAWRYKNDLVGDLELIVPPRRQIRTITCLYQLVPLSRKGFGRWVDLDSRADEPHLKSPTSTNSVLCLPKTAPKSNFMSRASREGCFTLPARCKPPRCFMEPSAIYLFAFLGGVVSLRVNINVGDQTK